MNAEAVGIGIGKAQRKCFSKIGFALITVFVIIFAIQYGIGLIPETVTEALGIDTGTSSVFTTLTSFLPLYAVAIPIGYVILNDVEKTKLEKRKLGAGRFFCFLLGCFPIMQIGGVIGNILALTLTGGRATNDLETLIFGADLLSAAFIVIIGPFFEELLFRKILIDRTVKYGEGVAVFFSAFAFALFHMNVYQTFYAFGLGLLFGYVYVRTGRLRYSFILHAVCNFMGGIIPMLIFKYLNFAELMENIDFSAGFESVMRVFISVLPAFILLLAYSSLQSCLKFAGIIALGFQCRKLKLSAPACGQTQKQAFRKAFLNVGVIIFIVLCVAVTFIYLYSPFIRA